MSLKFYNTMNRRKEEFSPINDKQVKMYTCGPTVYNYAHIGNFRAYMFEDLLRRTLKYCGYDVLQVMNLTDVDDKTIRDSQANKLPLREFTQKYKDSFFEDLETLKIEPAEHYPAATDHIPEMISIIETLMEKGYAYQAEDKSVYFSIAKFADYGKLAKIDMENQISGVRIDNDEYEKDSVADFALWKAWTAGDGDVIWDSPWGKGRPGWHIECSAMSMKYLGKSFDIHTGGIDNMFPHHEDEIAQSEAANGCTFVNYWLHCAHLIIDGEKMSKSLGNFFTLRDLIDKGYSGEEIRWVLLSAHYRKQLNFTFDACVQARTTLTKFKDLFARLREVNNENCDINKIKTLVEKTEIDFKNAIGDDLNISEALATLFELQKQTNKLIESKDISAEGADLILNQFKKFDMIFGVLNVEEKQDKVPAEIVELANKRVEARANKDFATADAIRDQLTAEGWIIEDSPDGPRIKRKNG